MWLSSLTSAATTLISSQPHNSDNYNALYSRLYFTIGTWLAHSLTFWVLNFCLFVCYRFNLFRKYRIQKELPSSELIMQCFQHNLLSHFVITPLLIYLIYPSFLAMGMSLSPEWPALHTIMRDLLFAVFINDTLFYWAHRGLHHPAIYKYIHKRHHLFKSNIGIASEFAHPIEDLTANVIPTIGGCLIIGSHVFVLWLWLVIRVFETVDAHSGYSFPYSPFRIFPFQGGAERHDFHHSHNAGCYGSFTIFWDWITGTDLPFLQYKEKLRNMQLKAEYEKANRKVD